VRETARIAIGTWLVRDGELCEVVALEAGELVVQDRLGGAARVRVTDLLRDAGPSGARLAGPGGGGAASLDWPGVLLGAADGQALAEACSRAAHVREVLCGYRSGSAELAAPGEPRPQYAAGIPLMQRYQAKAAELGVTSRTVRVWAGRYRDLGEAGLVDGRGVRVREPLKGVDPRWADACRAVLDEQVEESSVTKSLTLRRVRARLDRDFGEGCVSAPKGGAAYRALDELSRGLGSFSGSAKARRSIADRPAACYGRLRSTRPGEYVLLDSTRLDVFAMEPVTLRWVQAELTIAMDLFTRCIVGLRVTPVSTKSVDVASVLFEAVCPPEAPPEWPAEAAWPYHGVPEALVVDAGRADGPRFTGPGLLPDTIVIDHGSIYVSEHVTSACARLGISIQPTRPYTPTDKSPVERFFRTLREGLLEALPGYKGPDVFSRGKDAEHDAFFYLGELEAIIREWIAVVYHRRPHESLIDPRLPGLAMSPVQRYGYGIARAGRIEIPRDPDLRLEFLPLKWRTIKHYGVEIGGLRYNGAAAARYRDRTSPYQGARAGLWPFAVNPDDVSRIYFRDPGDGRWHELAWEHAADLDVPFSAETLAYAKALAARKERFPDTRRALLDLLEAWNLGLAANRIERRMALRLAAERAALQAPPQPEENVIALPAMRSVQLARQQDSGTDTPAAGSDVGAGHDGDFYADALETLE
jgi:transposase InsO family protein